jgi:hypothetical protein
MRDMKEASKFFNFILLCIAFGLLLLVSKRTLDNVNEQKLKEKECINKRVEINGSSYLIVNHDWFKDCYILDNGLSVDEELIWELLKEQK